MINQILLSTATEVVEFLRDGILFLFGMNLRLLIPYGKCGSTTGPSVAHSLKVKRRLVLSLFRHGNALPMSSHTICKFRSEAGKDVGREVWGNPTSGGQRLSHL